MLAKSSNNRISWLCRGDENLDALSAMTILTVAVNRAVAHRVHLNVSCRRKKWAKVRRKYRNAKK